MYGFFLSRKSVQTKVTPRVSKTGREEGGGVKATFGGEGGEGGGSLVIRLHEYRRGGQRDKHPDISTVPIID